MKVLCLLDNPVHPPDRWIWSFLPESVQSDKVDFLSASPRDRFPGWGKLFAYYPKFFQLAIFASRLIKKNNYDIILAWESKTGYPLAFLSNFIDFGSAKLVILAFSYKGIITNFPKVAKYSIRKVSHFTVGSSAEATFYQQELGIKADRISISPVGGYDVKQNSAIAMGEEDPFIFSGGRTGRDYETLFKAAIDINFKFIINAKRFNVKNINCPPNIQLNDFTSFSNLQNLMARSRFVIVPLLFTLYSAGIGILSKPCQLEKPL